MGTWIEIINLGKLSITEKSFPSWERGLKSLDRQTLPAPQTVVPLVGTWIEIDGCSDWSNAQRVVPLVGTWIEIGYMGKSEGIPVVVPLVGTWIEIRHLQSSVLTLPVVPLVGTWIEI